MSKNDITGDSLRSRPLSPEGEANWDRIFGGKKEHVHEHLVIEQVRQTTDIEARRHWVYTLRPEFAVVPVLALFGLLGVMLLTA